MMKTKANAPRTPSATKPVFEDELLASLEFVGKLTTIVVSTCA